MYSRRTGILQTSTEGLKKIESFNQNLKEQYSQRTNSAKIVPKEENKVNLQEQNSKISKLLGSEEVLLIGMIILLLFDTNKDYLLIGILATLLLINQ